MMGFIALPEGTYVLCSFFMYRCFFSCENLHFKVKDFRITGLSYTNHCNQVFIDIEISLVTKAMRQEIHNCEVISMVSFISDNSLMKNFPLKILNIIFVSLAFVVIQISYSMMQVHFFRFKLYAMRIN